jgi:hypothetical protein
MQGIKATRQQGRNARHKGIKGNKATRNKGIEAQRVV